MRHGGGKQQQELECGDKLFDCDDLLFGSLNDLSDILLALWIQVGYRFRLPETAANTDTRPIFLQLVPTFLIPHLDTLLVLSSNPLHHKRFISLFRSLTTNYILGDSAAAVIDLAQTAKGLDAISTPSTNCSSSIGVPSTPPDVNADFFHGPSPFIDETSTLLPSPPQDLNAGCRLSNSLPPRLVSPSHSQAAAAEGDSHFHRIAPTAFYRCQHSVVIGAPKVEVTAVHYECLPRGWSDRNRRKKDQLSDGSSTCWINSLTKDHIFGRSVPPVCWPIALQAVRYLINECKIDWSMIISYTSLNNSHPPRRICQTKLSSILFTGNTTERGPCLSITDQSMLNFEFQLQPDRLIQTRWIHTLQTLGACYLSFNDLICDQKKVGGGNFSQVYKGTHRITKEEVIIKCVEKRRLQQANGFTEILVLRALQHPAIVSLRAAFENDKTIVIVTEHLRGGDLYDYIKQRGPLAESEARKAIRRILEALSALHDKGIVHRDLKTENVMLRKSNDVTSVCLIDFGLASTIDSPLMTMRCGSPGYVAPEVLLDRGRYGTKCDVYSAGIVLYTMLTSRPPFKGQDARSILKKNAKSRIVFEVTENEADPWTGTHVSNSTGATDNSSDDHCSPVILSEEAKSLISWMTQKRPELRCSSREALQHPFFTRQRLRHIGSIRSNSESSCLALPEQLLSAEHQRCINNLV